MNTTREFKRIILTGKEPVLVFKYKNEDGSMMEEQKDLDDVLMIMTQFIDGKISFLKEKLANLSIDTGASDKEIFTLSDKINKLQAEKEVLNKVIRDYFILNAGRDFSRTNDLYVQAFNQFLNGNIDKAIVTLNEAKLFEKASYTAEELSQKADHCRLMATMYWTKNEIELARDNYEQAVALFPCWDHYMAAADFYRSTEDYESQSTFLQNAFSRATTNTEKVITFIELGNCANKKNNIKQAKEYYKEATLIGARSDEEAEYKYGTISAELNLAGLYIATDDFEQADSLLKSVFKEIQSLSKDEMVEYKDLLTTGIYTAAHSMQMANHYTQAEEHCLMAIDSIQRNVPTKNDNLSLIRFYNLLGIIYNKKSDAVNAHKYFDKGLDIVRSLANNGNAGYLNELARLLQNKGSCHLDFYEAATAEKYYLESLSIYRKLAKINPSVYMPELAVILSNTAILYRTIKKANEEWSAIKESLDILRSLTDYDPECYCIDMIIALNNSGNCLLDIDKIKEALDCYVEALNLISNYGKRNPERYLNYYALTFINLGTLQRLIGKSEAAIQSFEQALKIRTLLAQENPRSFFGDIAMTYINIGHVYSQDRLHEKAEESYKNALIIFEQEAVFQPDLYAFEVGMCWLNLTTIKADWKINRELSISSLTKAIKAFKPYMHIDKVVDYWRSVEAIAAVLEVDPYQILETTSD